MVLHVTDRASLEQSGISYHDIGILSENEDLGYLINRAGSFVETVLEFNPDATEQLDLRDKHLACADNLGEKARENISSLLKVQSDMCEAIGKIFQQPYPYWFRNILTGITDVASHMNPDLVELKISKLGRILEYLPRSSTPFKSFFLRFEQCRTIAERVVTSMDRTIAWLKKNDGLLLSQMEQLKSVSMSLARAIRLGLLIDQTLCETLTYEVPHGDPRESFISDDLLRRLRKRVNALHRLMDLNRQSLITIEIVNRNSLELVRGLELNKEAIFKTFNLGPACALALTHRRLVRGTLMDTPTDSESLGIKPTPEYHLENLKQNFTKILSAEDDLKSFLDLAGPTIRQTLESLKQLHEKTNAAFMNLKQSNVNGLGEDKMDMELSGNHM